MAQRRRGSQGGIFTKLKSDNQLDYVPTRTWVGNQIYLLSTLLAHNLGRELQVIAHSPSRITLEKRPALWDFVRHPTASAYPACRPADPPARPSHSQLVHKPRRPTSCCITWSSESCLRSANNENYATLGFT
ncbi:MAG: hypothetical protein M3436_04125 [Pseudomonadota bacterium]|nr:hypothetical protein [Pseudomonadota bacterium]